MPLIHGETFLLSQCEGKTKSAYQIQCSRIYQPVNGERDFMCVRQCPICSETQVTMSTSVYLNETMIAQWGIQTQHWTTRG